AVGPLGQGVGVHARGVSGGASEGSESVPKGDRPMTPRITVLTLGVRDLHASLAFYRDGLGFPTPGVIGEEYEHGAVVFIELESGLRLALWPRDSLAHDAGVALPDAGAPAISLGHNVRSREEVDAV